MPTPEPSFEEKIDYIYKELKWQKRSRFLNFTFKLFVIWILIFWAMNIAKWLESDQVINKISSTIWSIVKPIVTELVKDLWEAPINPENIPNSLIDQIKENPELLDNLKK